MENIKPLSSFSPSPVPPETERNGINRFYQGADRNFYGIALTIISLKQLSLPFQQCLKRKGRKS